MKTALITLTSIKFCPVGIAVIAFIFTLFRFLTVALSDGGSGEKVDVGLGGVNITVVMAWGS